MTKIQAEIPEVIQFVVGAQGRMPLAAERLNKAHGATNQEEKLTQDDLLTILSGETGDLVDKLKVQAILTLFQNLNETSIVLRELLPIMKPHDVAALYTAEAQAFANLTKEKVAEAPQEPVDNLTAKNKFLDRLANYKNRKAGQPADDEAVS